MQNVVFFLKKYGKDLIFGLCLCLCFLLSCYSIYCSSKNSSEPSTSELVGNVVNIDEEEKEESPTKLYVDIKGAVQNPGVYNVKEGSIINDVIALAGGFADDAYQEGINLSKKVTDEMVIYIYTENEAKTSTSSNPSSNTNTSCNITSYDIKDCVEKNESVIETNRNAFAADSQSTNQLININTASKTELTTLSGIGDVKAEAIITYRTTVGSFKSIEDILNVSGIGDAVFEKIKDYITV